MTSHPPLPYCPIALLPYCPIALLPYCLTALLSPPRPQPYGPLILQEFPSHCGAIKSRRNPDSPATHAGAFQSHCGAIKSDTGGIHTASSHYCFNPTVVRLKDAQACRLAVLLRGFNPTVVRLKGRPFRVLIQRKSLVSIPLWCD